MSESPLPYTAARRRHPHSFDNEDKDQQQQQQHQQNTTAFAVSGGGNQHLSDHDDKKHLQQHHTSYSFSSFSSLIAPTAAQLWNSAQNTLAAVQQSDPLIRHNNSWGSNLDSCSTQQQAAAVPISFEMPCRDRTNEFRTSAKSIQMKTQAANGLANRHNRQQMMQESLQFNQLAKRIGKDLSHTCAKMEKLTDLAKKKSLFEERSGEIEELSTIVRQDIAGLNKQIAQLQTYKNERFGAPSQSRKDQGEGHSKLVVVGLQTKLASVSKTFQNVLEMRTENLKQQKNRRDKFSRSQQVPTGLPPSSSTGYMNLLLAQGENNAASSNSVSLDMDSIQSQNQSLQMMDQSNAYVQARSSAMENIEKNISELGSIFSQLASMVSEQGEMITRIDTNVEETSLNVDAAHLELLRYFNAISKNRWLMLKIFGVLMIFFVVFVVFLT